MAKTLEGLSEKHAVNGSPVATKVVRYAKARQFVTVKGVGALRGDGLEIDKGVNLLKPIAEQVFGQRTRKRKAG